MFKKQHEICWFPFFLDIKFTFSHEDLILWRRLLNNLNIKELWNKCIETIADPRPAGFAAQPKVNIYMNRLFGYDWQLLRFVKWHLAHVHRFTWCLKCCRVFLNSYVLTGSGATDPLFEEVDTRQPTSPDPSLVNPDSSTQPISIDKYNLSPGFQIWRPNWGVSYAVYLVARVTPAKERPRGGRNLHFLISIFKKRSA